MDVLYKFNGDMNWQSLKGEQILGRVFVVSAAVLPGHRTVHFFFVNYVSSPPGLPDNFFLYFFFFLKGQAHLPAMIVFIAHLNLKSYSK